MSNFATNKTIAKNPAVLFFVMRKIIKKEL